MEVIGPPRSADPAWSLVTVTLKCTDLCSCIDGGDEPCDNVADGDEQDSNENSDGDDDDDLSDDDDEEEADALS